MAPLNPPGGDTGREAPVAIAGSGPVARLLACLLARDGHPVILLDDRPQAQNSADTRLYALSARSLELLETEGLYTRLGPSRCRVFSDLEITLYQESVRVRFAASDIGGFLLGGLVYARDLDQVLGTQMAALGIPTQRLDPGSIERTSGGWKIGTGEAAFPASLLVVAEGGHSRLREKLGMPVETRDYGEAALTCGLKTEHDPPSMPRQVFTPWGPLGLLPAPDGLLSCIFSMPVARARAWSNQTPAAFEALLTEATGGIYGRLSLATPPRAYPLRRLHALAYTGERLALAGDAAHVIHPFAGQGLNLGFEDVRVLVGQLKRCRDGGEEALHPALLRYGRRRRRENQRFLLALEALRVLFQKADPVGLRAALLEGLAHHALLRRPWIRHATGLADSRTVEPWT